MSNDIRELTLGDMDAVSGGMSAQITAAETPKGVLEVITTKGDNGLVLTTAVWLPGRHL